VPKQEAYFEPINWFRTVLHEAGHYAVTRIMPHGLYRRQIFQA